jgi:hypothetical protein
MGLWIGCVWFLWRTCLLLGGYRAGVVAMLLLLSPELVRYFPTEMTEPLYLFGVFGWMHAAARIMLGKERSMSAVAQGACMLTITLLARPVFQFIAPAALLGCLCCLAYWALSKKVISATGWKHRIPTVAMSLGFGLVIPLALIIKNGVVFGLWGLGTGSGIGLYLGTHPLFQGAEPGFLGFDFDVNLMAALANQAGHSHSLAADWATRQAAIWQLQSMSIADSMAFFARKLWWWLAHHPAQIEAFGSSLRKLRFFELATVGLSIVWLVYGGLRKTGSIRSARIAIAPAQWSFAAFLLAMFLIMLAQLLPILHNSRYSSTLLDPWLIPLAAFGVTFLLQPIFQTGLSQNRPWSIGSALRRTAFRAPPLVAFVIILILTFGGYNLARKREHIAIDPMHMGQTIARLEISDSNRIKPNGMDVQGDRAWITTRSSATLNIVIDQRDVDLLAQANLFNALWETEMAVRAPGRRCGIAETAYQTTDTRILQPAERLSLLLPMVADGEFHKLVTHATRELRPHESGSLRLVLNCPIGTLVEWRGTRLLESRHAWDAAAHVSHQPLTPVSKE